MNLMSSVARLARHPEEGLKLADRVVHLSREPKRRRQIQQVRDRLAHPRGKRR